MQKSDNVKNRILSCDMAARFKPKTGLVSSHATLLCVEYDSTQTGSESKLNSSDSLGQVLLGVKINDYQQFSLIGTKSMNPCFNQNLEII